MPLPRRRKAGQAPASAKPRARRQASKSMDIKNAEPVKTPTASSIKKKSNAQLIKRLETLSEEMSTIKAQAKLLSERESKTKAEILEILNDIGAKDDKGNKSYSTGAYNLTRQVKKTIKFNQDKASELCKKLGVYDQVTETKTVISEQLVEKLYGEDELSREDIDKMMDVKETIAFCMTAVKPDPEVEEV